MTLQIVERGGPRVSLPKGKGLEGEIRLMGWEKGATEVEGSSAIYPVKVIKRDFAEAFPKGTRIRANHDGLCEAGGDVRRIVAKTTGDPIAKEDGMYAPVIFAEQWSTFAREFADVVGMSISAAAEMEELPEDQEYNDWGQPIDEDGNVVKRTVSRFLTQEESPYNSVDVVEAPGADGRIVALALEAAQNKLAEMNVREAATFSLGTIKPKESQTPEATPPRVNKKEKHMDEQERNELRESITRDVTTAVVEALRPSAPASEQPTLGKMAEAVVAAGLTEAGRSEVYARVERGEALESAIATETAREAAINDEVERRLAERLETQRQTSEFSFGYTTDDKTGKPLGTEGEGASTLAAHEAEFEAAMQEG